MNKKLIWFIELLLWSVAIAVGVFAFVYVQSYSAQKTNSYYLFFKDIDGLQEGSPVRLMGMQIGYVQDIKVFDDKVFVSFLITKKHAVLPEKSTATVEFYGLGGSKSLEIVPLSDKIVSKNDDIIVTKEPYRIKQVFDVQANISRTIVQMSSTFAEAIPDSKIYKTRNLIKINSKIEDIDASVATVNRIAEEITEDIKKVNKDKENASNSNKD